jgi:hypothetical protein
MPNLQFQGVLKVAMKAFDRFRVPGAFPDDSIDSLQPTVPLIKLHNVEVFFYLINVIHTKERSRPSRREQRAEQQHR